MENQTVITAFISAAGIVVVALIGVWTARLARKSAQVSATVEERSKIVEGYDKLNEDLESRNKTLSDRVDVLSKRVEQCEEKQYSDRARISQLEYEKDQQHRQFQTLLDYCNNLVYLMRAAGITVPTQPHSIAEFLNRS